MPLEQLQKSVYPECPPPHRLMLGDNRHIFTICAHYGQYTPITESIYEAVRPHSPLLWPDLCWNCVEVQGEDHNEEEEDDEWREG